MMQRLQKAKDVLQSMDAVWDIVIGIQKAAGPLEVAYCCGTKQHTNALLSQHPVLSPRTPQEASSIPEVPPSTPSPPTTTLLIQGLPLDTTPREFALLFRFATGFEYAKLPPSPETHCWSGYVKFDCHENAMRVMRYINDQPFCIGFDHNPMQVQMSDYLDMPPPPPIGLQQALYNQTDRRRQCDVYPNALNPEAPKTALVECTHWVIK